MEKIFYHTEKISEEIRRITTYDADQEVLFELECFGVFLSDEEEIQNYLDDNGHGDEVFEFERFIPDNFREEAYNHQLELAKEVRENGINLVTCGDCGDVMLHKLSDKIIKCPYCFAEGEPCDFPDFKDGFKKALRILGVKKFSEEDLREAISQTRKGMLYSELPNH